MSITEVEACTGEFDCPATEHDEDTDCYSVTCNPPKCEQHGAEIITCRECAASPPAGWQLVECDRDHPVMWMPDDGWAYPPPCMYCSYAAIAKAHDGCEHSHHGAWRRWKIAHWLDRRAYALGLTAGGGRRWGGGCNSCLTGPRWRGKRSYILGWPRENWRCLLQGRHWPGEQIGMGLCGKCAPWPCCGSTGYEHAVDCPDELEAVAK